MGEARGGDGRPEDTGRTEHVQPPQWAGTAAGGPAALEKAAAPRREGKLDLNVPQVAGSAVAAIVAAKLASNLGVYGTIVGAGVVSVLGTCGGTILQHLFRRTGHQVQVVAVQARPAVRRVRDRTRVLPETGQAATGLGRLTGTTPLDGPLTDRGTTPYGGPLTGTTPLGGPLTGTTPYGGPLPGAGTPPLTGTTPLTGADPAAGSPALPATAGDTGPGDPDGPGGPDGYGEATSYRAGKPAGRRAWKRPVVAVALAFGLTMAGITGYEAIAGENISGHGHGTTIGNAVTGHDSPHSGGTKHTPAPTDSRTPSGGATGTPHRSDGDGRPGRDTTPSAPTPSGTPSPDTGGGSGGHTTPPPASTPPTTTPPSATTTPGDGSGAGAGSDGGDSLTP